MRKAAAEIVQFIGDSSLVTISESVAVLSYCQPIKDHDIDVTTFEGSVEVLSPYLSGIEKLKGMTMAKHKAPQFLDDEQAKIPNPVVSAASEAISAAQSTC
ncbi:hypothetical protein O9992_24350 [Vibrio lentus]|nr:hypothetical protein [Vibrio lentus]